MKVHILGRSYFDYSYSHWLRRIGIESHFFHETWMHPRLTLAWEFSELSDEDLRHIHPVDFLSLSPLGGQGVDILGRLADCDAIMCTGLSGWWAYLCGVPYMYQQFGGDLHTWPYQDTTSQETARSRLIRIILSNAKILCGFKHLKSNADRMDDLGLCTERYRPFAFPVDISRYKPLHDRARERLRQELGVNDKFVVFMPSQLMIKPVETLRYTKGTDVFIKGLQRFRQKKKTADLQIWITDRGWQRKESFAMLRELGLSDCVTPLPVVSKERLIRLFQAADVILDQINPDFGNCGGLTLEAMACGRCVLGHVDQDHRQTIAQEPYIPIVETRTPDDVAGAIERLYSSPDERVSLEAQSRAYAMNCHEPMAVARYYAHLLEEVCSCPIPEFEAYQLPGLPSLL